MWTNGSWNVLSHRGTIPAQYHQLLHNICFKQGFTHGYSFYWPFKQRIYLQKVNELKKWCEYSSSRNKTYSYTYRRRIYGRCIKTEQDLLIKGFRGGVVCIKNSTDISIHLTEMERHSFAGVGIISYLGISLPIAFKGTNNEAAPARYFNLKFVSL